MILATVKTLKRESAVCRKKCIIKYSKKYYKELSSFPVPYSGNPSSPNLPRQMAAQHLKLCAVHFLPHLADLLLPVRPTTQCHKCVGTAADSVTK